MDELKKWQSATAELYQKSNLVQRHGLFAQIDTSPLSVEGKEPPSERSAGRIFFNITPYQQNLFDEEFLNSPGCGVEIADEWPEKLNTKELFVYLQASPSLTPLKKALLQDHQSAKLNLGIDPFSLGLWQSKLFKCELSPEGVQRANEWGYSLFRLTGLPYDLSGASDVQQLAILLASVVQLISDYEGQISPEMILQSLSFELPLKPHLFASVVKVRGLRTLMARLAEVYQVPSKETPIYCHISMPWMARREPWNNILRLSAVSAAAKMAGADGLVATPYDALRKNPKGGRVARNVSEVLELESLLGQVSDPLLGSYTLENLETALLPKAWEFFCEIQKKDGIRACLRSGWLLDQVEVERDKQMQKLLRGDLILTGVNDFPLTSALSEQDPLPHESECVDLQEWWISQHRDLEAESLCHVARFVPQSLTAPFESWQFRRDRLAAAGHPTEIPTFVEPTLRNGPRWKQLKKRLALAGLEVDLREEDADQPLGPVTILLALDPEGEYSQRMRALFQQKKVTLPLWGGERDFPGFKDHVGGAKDPRPLYEKIFQQLEGQA